MPEWVLYHKSILNDVESQLFEKMTTEPKYKEKSQINANSTENVERTHQE